jgi:hypothetical protein
VTMPPDEERRFFSRVLVGPEAEVAELEPNRAVGTLLHELLHVRYGGRETGRRRRSPAWRGSRSGACRPRT